MQRVLSDAIKLRIKRERTDDKLEKEMSQINIKEIRRRLNTLLNRHSKNFRHMAYGDRSL